MPLITVPRLSTVDEPFSFRSLISVTLSPSASSAPFESLTLMSMRWLSFMRKSGAFPSPLVGEGGRRRPSAARSLIGRRCFASAMRNPCRMRGFGLSIGRDPSPVSHLTMRATLSHKGTHKGRGEEGSRRVALTQFDLVGDLMREADAAHGQNHFGLQFFMAHETAGLHGVAHRLFDFALRGDA